jgi:hypothetical protein
MFFLVHFKLTLSINFLEQVGVEVNTLVYIWLQTLLYQYRLLKLSQLF